MQLFPFPASIDQFEAARSITKPRHDPRFSPRWAVLTAVLAISLTACSTTTTAAGSTGAGTTAGSTTTGGTTTSSTTSASTTASGFAGGSATTDSPGNSSAVSTSPTVTQSQPAKTPVPAGTAGNIDQTVASSSQSTATTAPLSATAQFDQKVSVRIAGHQVVNAIARGPGETSGPAVALTFEIHNGSAKSIDLGNVEVNVADAARTPYTPVFSSDLNKPFGGKVSAGQRMSGTYVFSRPAGMKDPITVDIHYAAAAPAVVFVGSSQ